MGGNETTALARHEWRHKEDTVRYTTDGDLTMEHSGGRGGLSRGRRNDVTSKTEACPSRAVVGEGPARYTYLRSGDINKC